MVELILHHASVITRDLERSAQFYEGVLGLNRITRPPFTIKGTWLGAGPSLQVHLTAYDGGYFRTGPVDANDVHFAFRTTEFEPILARLQAAGYSDGLPVDDPLHMILRRTGAAGFAQLYVLDPDRNIIEINGAA